MLVRDTRAQSVPNITLTPRPLPEIFDSSQRNFSHKKNRRCTVGSPATLPRAPVKSAPPVSRIFPHRLLSEQRPQAVSFRNDSNISSFLDASLYNKKNKRLFFNQGFEVECKLGNGSFGEVFKAKCKSDGEFYAVKISQDCFRGESDRRRRMEEVRRHELLGRHGNCLAFHRAWEERGRLYIQTELCAESLASYAERHHDLPTSRLIDWLVDLLTGLRHLHDQDLVHLDIKPDNILVGLDGRLKLADFGLMVDTTQCRSGSPQEGDPAYLAPELLQGDFGKPADVFSLGVALLELATDLDPPSGGPTWHRLRRAPLPVELLQSIGDPTLGELIQSMMDPNPSTRPTVRQLLAAPRLVWAARKRKLKLLLVSTTTKLSTYFLAVLSFLYFLFILPWKRFIPRRNSAAQCRQITSTAPDMVVNESSVSEVDEVFLGSPRIPDPAMFSDGEDWLPTPFPSSSTPFPVSSARIPQPNPRLFPPPSPPPPPPRRGEVRGTVSGPSHNETPPVDGLSDSDGFQPINSIEPKTLFVNSANHDSDSDYSSHY